MGAEQFLSNLFNSNHNIIVGFKKIIFVLMSSRKGNKSEYNVRIESKLRKQYLTCYIILNLYRHMKYTSHSTVDYYSY